MPLSFRQLLIPSILVVCTFLIVGCDSEPAIQPPVTELQTFDELEEWVKAQHRVEVMRPLQSSLIVKAEYYPDGQYLILYFKDQPLDGFIYHQVKPELWKAFLAAESKGKFYHARIKGNSLFRIPLP